MNNWCRVPHPWTLRHFLGNVKSILEDLFWYGPRNLLRWAPIIWLDVDFDWEPLAWVMEFKLRKMAECQEQYGHHVGSERAARQMRICAYLLRRLEADEYFLTTDGDFPKHKFAGMAADNIAMQDEQLLFKIMQKHWREWWD